MLCQVQRIGRVVNSGTAGQQLPLPLSAMEAPAAYVVEGGGVAAANWTYLLEASEPEHCCCCCGGGGG